MGKPNNTVTLQGFLAFKPELAKTSTGGFYTKIYLSLDESYTNFKTKERVEKSQLVPVVIFGDAAKVVCQKGEKKDPVKVVGHVQTNTYQDRETGREVRNLQVQVSNSKDSVKLLFKKR